MIKKLYWFLFVRALNDTTGYTPVWRGVPLKRKLMQDVAYLLLCSYVLLIISPVMPVMSDIIAQTFRKQEHLQTAHHRYGNDHMGFEIVKAEKTAGKGNTADNQQSGLEELFQTITVDVQLLYTAECVVKQAYSLYRCDRLSSWLDIDYPPPRV